MKLPKTLSFIFLGLAMLLIVACTPQTVTIKFISNGGTNIENVLIEQGKELNAPEVSRPGYSLEGWYESENFDPSTKVTFPKTVTRNMTFYAKWTINSYTINYFPNNDTEIDSVTLNFGADINLPNVTKVGYTFEGWYTNEALTGNEFNLSKMPANDLNLYAKWKIRQLTITFLINEEVYQTRTVNYGETLTDIPVPPIINGKVRYWDTVDFTNITEDKDVHLLEEDAYYTVTIKDEWGHVYETLEVKHGENFVPTVTPSKEGYIFVGYNPGLSHVVVSNMDVLVVYQQITFNVIFRNHEGTVIKQMTVNYGDDAIAPQYNAPEGFEFVGWNGSFENVTSNLIIDAVIKPLVYEIKLFGNGGLFGTEELLVIEKNFQETVGIPTQPTRLGYTFAGWYFNPEGTGNSYQFSAGTTMPKDGLMLYARWILTSFSISYQNLQGTTHGNPTSYHITTPTINLSNPSNRLGYQFNGWYTALNGGDVVTTINTSVLSNQTVYARWTPITYTITYSNLFGTTHSNPLSYTIESNQITLDNPTDRLGYNFIGWFTSEVGGTKVEQITTGSTGNQTVYARWTAKQYTITYQTNGGTVLANQTVTYNQNFTLGTTSKTGYTFLGWTLNGDDFVAGVWEIDSDITLVAKYQANVYTITYNGLTNESHLNPLNYTIETETIHLSAPSERLGYQFNGWFTQAMGGSKVESIQLGSTGNRTLYAQFSPIIYDITYLNLEGSTTSNPLNYTIETQTFTLSDPTARQHYQFVGWYTELVGGTLVTKIELGSTEDVILYARWTPITYSITYANLQSSTHSNPLTYTIETDTIILLDPTNRIGYTFAGWYTQLTLGQRVYEIDTNSADDLTLFARWTANSYTIEFDVDGGMPISDMTVTYGQSFTLPNAQKLGFTFAGWELDGNIFTSGIWNLDENIFLVAVWTEWPTIIFDLHGGVGTLVISQAPGSNISAPAVNPVKDGYTFLHYYVSDENTAYVFDVMPEEDLVLHAKWEAIIYEIKYENLFGLDSNNVDTFTIEDEDITLLDPESRTGYTFSGWFDQLIGGLRVYEISQGTIGDLTLYARWTAKQYTITYQTNGGTILADQTVTYNQNFTLGTTSKTGYTFLGWTLDGDDFVAGIWNIDSNITLVAKYEVINFTISYIDEFTQPHTNPTSYNIETPSFTLVSPSIKTGYQFDGWYDQEELGNKVTSIQLGSTGNKILYARWIPLSFVVSFDTQGGSEVANLEVTFNASYTLPTAVTKLGYTFVGWTLDSNPMNQTGTWTIPDDVTLVASYTPVIYSITYLELYDEDHENPLTYTIETSTIILIEPTTREHYEFAGWFDENDQEVFEIELGTTGNITLYAKWVAVSYAIHYMDLEGALPNNPLSYTIEDSFQLEDPSIRTGFKFLGWFEEEGSTTRILEIEAGTYGEITLYARWEVAYYDVHGEFFYESVEISSDRLSIIEGNIILDGQQSFVISNLLHGTEITPIIEQEGYIFNRFVYNGVIYDNIEALLLVTDDMQGVEVYYRRIILELVFTQKGEGNSTISDTRFVYYNEELDESFIPAVLNDNQNITAIWERILFTNIREAMNITALYFDNEAKTIRFVDNNSIIFIASQGDDEEAIFIGEDSPIWVLTRPGYKFLGWYYLADGVEVKLTQGDYAFDDFDGNQVEVYSKWKTLVAYQQPYDISVNVSQSGNTITITWKLDLLGQVQPNFNLYIDKVLINDYTSLVTKDGLVFTLVITSEHPDHAKFIKLTETGLHSVSIQAIGDQVDTTDSILSDEFIFERKSIYDDAPENTAIYDYFIIEEFEESTRYIFYTNMTYQFNVLYTFEILSGSDLVSIENGSTLKMKNIAGSFKFKMTRPNGTSDTYDALIVKDIKQFGYGSNYQTYLTETSGASTYIDTDVPYYVGAQNNFYLDARLTNSQGNRINIDDAILTYKFYIKTGVNTWIEIDDEDLADHLSMQPKNRIKFKNAAIGNTYQIEITPKYQSLNMQAQTLIYVVTVNNGHNAFTNQELKELYSNSSISLINLHSNITAQLSPNQMNADGSPKNIANGAGNVYNRVTLDNNDSIRIEGNFMTINGSQLPYSNGRSGSGLVGYADAFEIVNMQIGIFNYSGGNGEISSGDGLPKNYIQVENNAKFVMNNLTIIGNTTVPSINLGGTAEDILLQERLMSRNSGGYIGVFNTQGAVEINNSQIKFTVIAVSTRAKGFTLVNEEQVKISTVLNKVIIDDSWANGVYSHGADITINDSYLGQSGGSIIHAVDIRPNGGIYNPTIRINRTTMENYISGEEAWFKAYGMTLIALQLKSGIESGILSTGRSIIKEVVNPVTGLETEMLNFILLTEPYSEAEVRDEENVQLSGSEVRVIIDGYESNRAFNYLQSGDPRITGGQYAFPMGLYSDVTDFLALANNIGNYAYQQYGVVLDLPTISNLSMLAAFYNLSASQIADAAIISGGDQATMNSMIQSAVLSNIGNNILPPSYFEVLAPIPIFPSGYSIAIIELVPLQ